ncbi:MAG: hypothetical protein KatS3mg029_0140 [Saprospiraceae bacterium]|nr:MAG: hypothetical protein KatS3mg029_0140 [Saprospiraceae bacterium]
MKNTLLIGGLLLLALSACKQETFDANSFIELKKDPCFGFCPVYEFRIDGTGQAIFKGIRNVEKTGTWKRQLDPEATRKLFQSFIDADVWQFEDEYAGEVSDMPTIWLTFSHQGRTKRIMDYFGAPAKLKELEALVEAIAESQEGWEQVAPPASTQ